MGGEGADPLKTYKVFQRINDKDADVKEWQARMDQLLLSDPIELLSFASDAVIAVAAQLNVPIDEAWASTVEGMSRAASGPERERVIEMTRKRIEQILAIASEGIDAPTPLIRAAFHKKSRESPWPEE